MVVELQGATRTKNTKPTGSPKIIDQDTLLVRPHTRNVDGKKNSAPPRRQGTFPVTNITTGPEKASEGGVIFPDKFRRTGPKITEIVTTQDLNPYNDIYTVEFPNGDKKAFRGDDPRLRSALSRRGKRKPAKTTELAEGIDVFGVDRPRLGSVKNDNQVFDFGFDFGMDSLSTKKSSRKKDLIDDAFSIPDFDFSLGFDPEF